MSNENTNATLAYTEAEAQTILDTYKPIVDCLALDLSAFETPPGEDAPLTASKLQELFDQAVQEHQEETGEGAEAARSNVLREMGTLIAEAALAVTSALMYDPDLVVKTIREAGTHPKGADATEQDVRDSVERLTGLFNHSSVTIVTIITSKDESGAQ